MKNRFINLILLILTIVFAFSTSAEVRYNFKGEVTFTYYSPQAVRVELIGDFTGFKPFDMKKDEHGFFTYKISLPPGKYKYYYLVNRLFRRHDPDNPDELGRFSILNLSYGHIIDYVDGRLNLALIVNFQPSIFEKSDVVYKKVLTSLAALKIPFDISFNGNFYSFMKNDPKWINTLNSLKSKEIIGNIQTKSILNGFSPDNYYKMQIGDWKQAFLKDFRYSPKSIVFPYLTLDNKLINIAKKYGYNTFFFERQNENYPLAGNGMKFFPCLKISNIWSYILSEKTSDYIDKFLEDSGEKGEFYPFICLYWQIGDTSSLSSIIKVLDQLKVLSYKENVKFKTISEADVFKSYNEQPCSIKYKTLLSKSAWKDYYYDKFEFFNSFLKHNAPGNEFLRKYHKFWLSAMENYYVLDSRKHKTEFESINKEYLALKVDKPLSHIRLYESKNSVFFENKKMILSINKKNAKPVEIFNLNKEKDILLSMDCGDMLLNGIPLKDFEYSKIVDNKLVFVKKVDSDEPLFMSIYIWIKDNKFYYRIIFENKSRVSREYRLRIAYNWMEGMNPRIRFYDKAENDIFSFKTSKFLYISRNFMETRPFRIKPGKDYKLDLEVSFK